MKKAPTTDTIRLRTMTRKSVLNWGKYADLTIGQIIDCGKKKYIKWLYYYCQWANFTTDVLKEVGITGQWIIEKPGVNHEAYRELIFRRFEYAKMKAYGEEKGSLVARYIMKIRLKKQALKRYAKAIAETTFSKAQMQAMNHGHMKFR